MLNLSELSQIQQDAVLFDKNKPLIILAGAGSGKTKVLTYRAAHFIEDEKIPAEEILLLTFTNKAAGEMLSRIRRLINQKGSPLLGGTFHSFCVRILRKYGSIIDVEPTFSVFDENDQIETVKRAMQLLAIDIKSVRPGSVLGAISDAKNNLVGPTEYGGYARGDFQKTAARVYLVYQKLLKKFNALDFDDLLLQTVRMLKENQTVVESVRKIFSYVLVDEYQDTNKAQYELTRLLTVHNQHLTVVGDAAQAIYSWRGADYRNLLYLKQDYPEITTLNLEQNYRSTQNILKAANEIIGKNKNHPVLKLWTEKDDGEKITIYQAESELDEAAYILFEIKKRLSNGMDLSDFAVLYRTNAQSRVIEEAMLHAGLPYVLFGGTRFYERKEVKDILAYLKILVNPSDEVARKRAEKIGKIRMGKLEKSRLELDTSLPTVSVLDAVLKITGYTDLLDINNEEDAMRIENIKELRSVALEFPELSEFLQQIALTERESKSHGVNLNDANRKAVLLMTLHAAKGLEFKTVFMVGMEEGLFPHSRTLMNNEDMEEERRLCYVGMTRAKDKLYMTCASKRLYFGQRNANPVSRFLADIPEELLSLKVNIKPAKIVSEGWGFDENGEWRWSPDE